VAIVLGGRCPVSSCPGGYDPDTEKIAMEQYSLISLGAVGMIQKCETEVISERAKVVQQNTCDLVPTSALTGVLVQPTHTAGGSWCVLVTACGSNMHF